MRLTLDRIDLKQEFESMHCRQIAFEHFQPKVQLAIASTIRGVGSAQFREFDGSNYNAIHLPPDDADGVIGDGNVILKGSGNRVNISHY